MDKDNLSEVLTEMGVGKIQSFYASDNLQVKCPLAPWFHGSGADSRPSCSIKIVDDGPSLFYCFSCHEGGIFARMVREWATHTDTEDAEKLAKKVAHLEDTPLELLLERARIKRETRRQVRDKIEVWNERELDDFSGVIPRYAIRRGVTLEMAKKYGLGYDRYKKRLVFPIRRSDGKLVGIQGRAIRADVMPPWFNYWNFEKSRFLFGEHDVQLGKRCVLVEGLFDVLVWRSYGIPNVLGLMGSSISHDQRAKLLSISDSVAIVMDGDKAGRVGAQKIAKTLSGRARLFIVGLDDGVDPADLTADQARFALEETAISL